MGNQGQASEETRLQCETIWDGAIGQVREVHVWTDRPLNGIDKWYWPQGVDRPKGEDAVPEIAQLGPLARPGADASVCEERLQSLRLARLVGFRHRRPRRYRLP